MSITLQDLRAHVAHAGGGGATASLPPAATGTATAAGNFMVNEAGRLLYASNSWNFRRRPPALLAISSISFTNATWTESSKTLTKASGFTSYLHSAGQEVTISDGTGATTGNYTISSKTSDNAIVLLSSIGSDADGQSDIDGEIVLHYVALPSDFGEWDKLELAARTEHFQLTTPAQIARMRADSIVPANFMYWGAIVYPQADDVTETWPGPKLEIYPEPTSSDTEFGYLWYWADWPALSSDTDYAQVPPWCESLLIQFVRAVADGYEHQNSRSGVALNDRLNKVIDGPVFKQALSRDGQSQGGYGVVTNGAAMRPWGTERDYLEGGTFSDPA